jgi:tetratricopeptide (TPR) repeat protein
MTYDLSLVGLVFSAVACGFLLFMLAALLVLKLKQPAWHALGWSVVLVVGLIVFSLGRIWLKDRYYVDETVAIAGGGLLLFYWASQNKNVLEILKSWGFVALTLMLAVVFFGPDLLERVTEIGTSGLKLAQPTDRRQVLARLNREPHVAPKELLAVALQVKAVAEKDVAVLRIRAYHLAANMITYADTVLSPEARRRETWANEIHQKAVKGQLLIDQRETKRHVDSWATVLRYEEFARFFEKHLEKDLKQAKRDEELGKRNRAARIVRKLLSRLQDSDAEKFAGSVYYYHYLLIQLHLYFRDLEATVTSAYEGVTRFRDDMNANLGLAEVLWFENSDALTAKRYYERALESATQTAATIDEEHRLTLGALTAARLQATGPKRDIIDREIDEVMKHRDSSVGKSLQGRYKGAQIALKNTIAYLAAVEGIDETKARAYAEEVYQSESTRPEYVDTYGYVKLRFAGGGETGKTEAKGALNLLKTAEELAKRRISDRDDLQGMLQTIRSHQREALQHLRTSER